MMKLKKKHGWLRDREGITSVEFALISPVLFLLLMGIIEIGLIMYTFTVMEGVTNFGARIGKTGFTPEGTDRADYLRTNILARLNTTLIDPHKIQIRVTRTSTWDDAGPVCPPDGDCFDPGEGGQIVLYESRYPWTFFTPLVGTLFPDPLWITAVTPVRNEEF